MFRLAGIVIFLFSFLDAVCQNGYVRLKERDSTIVGYVRRYRSAVDGTTGVEVWRDKKDREPRRILNIAIDEFAIKSDTFRILHQFKPFPEIITFYEYIEAKIVSRGRLTLMIIYNFPDPGSVSNYTGGGLAPAVIDLTGNNSLKKRMGFHSNMYVLENASGRDAVPPGKNELREILFDYFPDRFVEKYISIYGDVTYKTIDDMMIFYNSK